MKRLILLILVVYIALPGKSQDIVKHAPVNLYSVKQLRTDFVYFKSALETLHPSLYRYHSKDSLDAWFMASLQSIDHPMSDVEFFLLLSRSVAKIGSAHTGVIPGEPLIKQLGDTTHTFLPFFVFIQKNHVYLKRWVGRPDTSFRMGDEILAINNEPALNVLTQLRQLLPCDGYSQTYRDYKLEQNSFRALYNFMHGNPPDFLITYRSGAVVKTKVVKASVTSLKPVTDNGRTDKQQTGSTHRALGLDGPDSLKHKIFYPADISSTAIVKIADFTYVDDFESFHKKLFKELQQKKIENLVIDLRNNPGGKDEVCIDMMKYFMASDFRYTQKNEWVVNADKVKKFIAFAATRPQPAIADFSTIDHKFSSETTEPEHPRRGKNAFKGKIYILINHGTFSAASLMATAIKEQRQCTLIGEETGGGRAGSDAGMGADIVLPYTRCEVLIPLSWTYSMTSMPDEGEGLKPDINFTPNAQELYDDMYKKTDPFNKVIKTTIVSGK